MSQDDYPQREYPFLSRSIRRMKEFGPSAMDRDHPEGRCGMQYWFEFTDRATAEQFERDLARFARSWIPDAAGEVP
jgi:hypothetical protein